MSLRHIIDEIAAETGRDISTTAGRKLLLNKINRAARGLYMTRDLEGSRFESYAVIDRDTRLSVLPWQVEKVYGYRDIDRGVTEYAEGFFPRYQKSPWDFMIDRFRNVGMKPTNMKKLDLSPVRIVIAQAQAVDMTVILTGSTDKVTRMREEVTIPAGSLEATSLSNWDEFISIYRKGEDFFPIDIDIRNLEDEDIATLVNVLDHTRYTVIQTSEDANTYDQDLLVEMLFKHRFVPFIEDEDEFIAGPEYDEAIKFATRGLLAMNDGNAKEASDFGTLADNYAHKIHNDRKNAEHNQMMMSENVLYTAQERSMNNFFNNYLLDTNQ